MTLGQFATIVGASPRWVQNALAVLQHPGRYTLENARLLALARVLGKTCAMPLIAAYSMAQRALAAWPAEETWESVGADGSVRLVVDLRRFLSNVTARLALTRTLYAERRRGRRPRRRLRGVRGARAYGVDLSLLRSPLQRTAGERLRRLDEDVAFVRAMRVVGR